METMDVSVSGLQWSRSSYFRNRQLNAELDWCPEEQYVFFLLLLITWMALLLISLLHF